MPMTRDQQRMEQIEKALEELRAAQSAAAAKQAASDSKLDAILAQLKSSDHFDRGPDPSLSKSESSPTPMLQKMEMPSFDGSDARAWLARAEQYFLVHQTPAAKKVEFAVIALSGSSMSWYQLLIRRIPNPDWVTFRQELLIRYGDESAINGYEALLAVKQTGSLEEYIAAFENRVSQIPDFSDAHYLGFFLGGLKKHLRAQIQDSVIFSYSAALQAARKIDHATSPAPPSNPTRFVPMMNYSTRPSYTHPSHSASQGSIPQASTLPTYSQGSSAPRSSRNFRQVSNDEFRKHMAARTCFRCGGKFGPMHRCPPKTLQVLIGDEDDEQSDELQQPQGVSLEEKELEEAAELQQLQLSELTSFGFDGPQTMKLFGRVGDTRLLLMVDNGASHCFVSEKVARKLNWQIEPTTSFSVVLGDGSRVRTGGICKDVPLTLDTETFYISCYVFPICSVDMILGVSWLATLGEVKANWRNLTMEFSLNGRLQCLRGDPSLTRRACSIHELCSGEQGDECWALRSLDGGATLERFGVSESLSPSAKNELEAVLAAFPSVSAPSASLPPARE
ncbi:uncharacterized protein LOC131021105 [Salvia miltiorrhiza]|uniref:uncharacterized protein LOC131021105 n=1 Tax=Salvia miltiorrhiza TaxID=226208 RepID=UPI0025ACCC90|nr:uncharacterized protein LOC131021105 [Salvia miltiorrhiza]